MIQLPSFKLLRRNQPHTDDTLHMSSVPGGTAIQGLASGTQISLMANPRPRLSIHRHPHDLRRTVISGRFAEVCAALEGLAAAEA